MSAQLHETAGGRFDGGNAVALGTADRLSLAAAPTFAGMAVLTGVMEIGRADILCSATHAYSHLGGMAAMYVLMSTFHLGPWLKWISRRSNASRSTPLSQLKSTFRVLKNPANRHKAVGFSPREKQIS